MEENNKALYRRYRSMSFDELIGQEHATELLKAAVKKGTFSHAYLFTGQRGTGKTSAARILAYAINNLPYSSDEQHLDIIEIDAASNRRIDDIRDLREKVHIAPVYAKYKVYIIDEVHMLTGESFNALLKTIEEPPEHAVFILATTELHKVPATIISRTQRFHFRPVAPAKVAEHLASIAKKEKIDIEPEALKLIAEHGGGSFRDSISLLDQLGSLEGKVTSEVVESVLGRVRSSAVNNLLELVEQNNETGVHELLDELYSQGASPVTLSEQLVDSLLKASTGNQRKYELIEKLMSIPKAHFPQLSLMNTLLSFVASTGPEIEEGRKKKEEVPEEREKTEDKEEEKDTKYPAKRVTRGGAAPTETRLERGEDGADRVAAYVPQARNFTVENKFSPEGSLADSHRLSSPASSDLHSGSEAGAYDGSGEDSETGEEGRQQEEKTVKEPLNNEEFDWDKVLSAVKKTNPPLYGVLTRGEKSFSGNTLTLNFQYALHRKKMDQAQYKTQLIQAIKDTCGLAPEIIIADSKTNPGDETTKKVADIMGGGEAVAV